MSETSETSKSSDQKPTDPKASLSKESATGAGPTPTSASVPSRTPGTASAAKPGAQKSSGELARQFKAGAAAVRTYFLKKMSVLGQFFELASSLFSHDPLTRRVALIFFMSFIGMVSLASFALRNYWEARKEFLIAEAKIRSEKLKVIIKKEAEEARRKASLLKVGTFLLEMKQIVGQRLSPGQINMAEVELSILCDSAETRGFVESHLIQVRNQLTGVFTALDREELLTREGKRRIKAILIRRINDWLPHGHVEDIYFSKLLIS